MDSLLRLRYMAASDSNRAMLCPVGSSWRRIRLLYPGINLYSPDERHPSEAGTYAAACSFYSSIFGKSPVGAGYTGSLMLSDAADIQAAAKAVVHDSLAYWRQWWRPTAAPNAAFGENITGTTVTFISSSLYATTFAWTFGDGGSSTLANPTHTYSMPRSYMVRLVVTSACGDVDTLSKTIQIATTGLFTNPIAGNAPTIFPNPVRGTLHLRDLNGHYNRLQLQDVMGRILADEALENAAGHHKLDMEDIPGGLYQLILTGGAYRRIILVEKSR
jgi:hypothetical protein